MATNNRWMMIGDVHKIWPPPDTKKGCTHKNGVNPSLSNNGGSGLTVTTDKHSSRQIFYVILSLLHLG